jgi:hypothetical protein
MLAPRLCTIPGEFRVPQSVETSPQGTGTCCGKSTIPFLQLKSLPLEMATEDTLSNLPLRFDPHPGLSHSRQKFALWQTHICVLAQPL